MKSRRRWWLAVDRRVYSNWSLLVQGSFSHAHGSFNHAKGTAKQTSKYSSNVLAPSVQFVLRQIDAGKGGSVSPCRKQVMLTRQTCIPAKSQ